MVVLTGAEDAGIGRNLQRGGFFCASSPARLSSGAAAQGGSGGARLQQGRRWLGFPVKKINVGKVLKL
jgi:hypothetical protein